MPNEISTFTFTLFWNTHAQTRYLYIGTIVYNIGTLTMTLRHDTMTNLNWVPIHLISVVAAWMLFNRLVSRLVFNYYLLVYIKITCWCVSTHIIVSTIIIILYSLQIEAIRIVSIFTLIIRLIPLISSYLITIKNIVTYLFKR